MVLAAVTQLTSSPVILDNLATAVSLIGRAASAGAKAVFLPEATDFIAPTTSVSQLTKSKENADFLSGILRAAREHRVFVSVGIHEPGQSSPSSSSSAPSAAGRERCYNTQLVVDDRGEVKCRYRKAHLFDVDIKGGMRIKESDTTIPGSDFEASIPSPVGNIGALTCYDLRFPEASLHLRRSGSHILTFPSAFTVRTGAAHWEVLLRARAIETQSYVVAAAQAGSHPDTKRVSWGHAMIVDPWGDVVAQCPDDHQPTFAMADINLDYLERIRREMPLWEQRRHADRLYPEI